MVGMKGVVSIVCRLVLTVAFAFAGVVKLSPKLDAAAHEELVKEFETYSKIFSSDKLGFSSDQMRVFVATLEIVSALLLWIVPLAGSMLLSGLMIGAVYTHFTLGELSRLQPPAILGLLSAAVFMLSSPATPPIAAPIQKKTE